MSTFFSQLASVRWQDIIDILVVSYFLFRLYVLFRGTYVLRVITGIGFLWVFQRIAAYLGLIITTWAMQGIIAFLAIIIIIVFRNEIKNVLQAKDVGAILWGVSHKTFLASEEIVSSSVYALAQKKIGALLVLPAKDDLHEVVRGGISWQGVISKEMILSIFWPDNPVHDGAAIIRGGKISEVGAILPLSCSSDIPSSYGTRHRAALGLSEKTDALIIIVSEETGHVLVARNGKIKKINDNLELQKILQEHSGISIDDQGVRQGEFFKLGLAAAVLLIFVTGIWYSFSRGLETLVALEVPIVYQNRDPGMELMGSSLNTVNVHLSGAGALIRSIKPEQVTVRVSLDKAVIGLNSFTITQDNISLPPGVILKKVEPQLVDVSLDIPIKKKLPIQIDWIGKLADHLILESASVDPKRVSVIGGSKILEHINTIYTEKVYLENIDKSGRRSVNLILNPASLKASRSSNSQLTITYVVKSRGKKAER
ncbi:MAG: diadenylate cyclase CdaA [Thermodesulfobacteriota bacterium]|nr:diadenylate cyclase CdaA [Thermodesulfobacteriota bacterium]